MIKRVVLISLLTLSFFTQFIEGVCAENNSSIKIDIRALRGKERCLQTWIPTANYLSAKIPNTTFSIVHSGLNKITDAVNNLTRQSFDGMHNTMIYRVLYRTVLESTIATATLEQTATKGEFTFVDVLKKYWLLTLGFVAVFIILVFVTIFIIRFHQNLRLANRKLEKAIAECILIENESKKSEAKYRSLFESTPDAILILDKNGFIDCNSATLTMFGYTSKKEFTSLPLVQSSALKQPDGRPSTEASLGYIEEALTKGSTFFEWLFIKQDGTAFSAEVMLSRLEVEGKDVTQALIRDVTSRKQIETDRERLINELQEALGQVKTLKGMLPICANCKKVRDDKGYWNQIETYVQQHTDASFTHGLCPDCAKQLYPELYAERKKRKEKTWEFD